MTDLSRHEVADALALAEPGESLELVVRTALRRRIRMDQNTVESADDARTALALVRSSYAGSVGYATTSRTDAAGLAAAVRVARRLRAPGVLLPRSGGAARSSTTAGPRESPAELAGMSIGESVEFMRGAAAVDGAGRVQVLLDQVAEDVTVAGSVGHVVRYHRAEATLAVNVAVTDDGRRGVGTAGRTASTLDGLDLPVLGAEAVGEARARLGSRNGSSTGNGSPMVMDLLVEPRAAARLVAQIAAVFYGDRPDLDRTGLRALGNSVLRPGFGLVDDGVSGLGGLSAIPCDDEGTPTRRTAVIDDGRLATLLHDRCSPSSERGESSTGNGWLAPTGSATGSGLAVSGSVLMLTGPQRDAGSLSLGPGTMLCVSRIDDGSGRAVDAVHDSIRFSASGWLLRDGEPAGAVASAAIGMRLSEFLYRLDGLSRQRVVYRVAAGSTLRKGPAVHSAHLLFHDIPVTFQEAS